MIPIPICWTLAVAVLGGCARAALDEKQARGWADALGARLQALRDNEMKIGEIIDGFSAVRWQHWRDLP